MSLPKVLTTPDVVQMLGKSSRTVHRLVHDGKLPALKQMSGPNGAFLFDPADVERFMKASTKVRTAA